MKNEALAYISVNCPLCGSPDFSLRYPASKGVRETMTAEHFRCTSSYLSRHGDIVQCNRCHLIFSNPQLDPKQVLEIYRAVEDPLYLEEQAARERTFTRSLRQLQHVAAPPGRLLDVGCYTGVFMKLAARSGWSVSGVELSAWAAAIANHGGYGQVYCKTLETCALEPISFNVVSLWDVIEHLSHPAALLKDIHGLLKPGGIVAISTHLVDSLAARLLGSRYPFFMDMHVVHFSKPTLNRLLNECGFEVLVWRRHVRVLRLGYFLDKLEKRVRLAPLKSTLHWLGRRKPLRRLFITVGSLGLANVFARKI